MNGEPVPLPAGDAREPASERDPWVIGGMILLLVVTLAGIQLYRSAPRSAAELGSRAWLSVSPNAFAPRIARAREAYQAAAGARAAGRDSAAVDGYAVAADLAAEARTVAKEDADRSAATELWASALLDRAELLLGLGAEPWWRPDDNRLLEQALSSVEQVMQTPMAPATRERAATLRRELRAKLRPGPLELLPLPR